MLQCLEKEPSQNQLLVHLAILTGCRRGELLALTWDDIDYDTGIITVSKSNYQMPGGEVRTKTPKTRGSIRQVAVPEYCLEMLRAYQEKQPELLTGENKGKWIFTRADGSPMPPQRATRWFSDFLFRNHLRHRKFHSLRHTSATLLLLNGTDIKTVSARLGHTQLSTTNRYVHALSEADLNAAKLLGRLFAGGDKARPFQSQNRYKFFQNLFCHPFLAQNKKISKKFFLDLKVPRKIVKIRRKIIF